MKKWKKVIGLVSGMMLLLSSIAFADFSGEEAQQAVQNKYPDAMIMSVEETDGDNGLVWEVVFHSEKIAPSTMVFNADTGEIVSQDIHYR